MPDISQDLQKILDARYGEDVRGAIHDSIEDINDVCESYKGDVETARDQAVASANSANTAKQYCETLAQQFDKAFIYIGTVTWAEFLALTNVHTGYTWNISEEFTTTADFKEGTGHEYPAGTNVVRTNDNMWDVLTGISEGSGIKKITAAEFLANEAYYRGSGKTYWISDGQNYILNAQAMAFTPTTQISSTNVQSAIEEVSNSLAKLENISNEEVVIGTWSDGKTLYRKPIKATISTYQDSTNRRLLYYTIPEEYNVKKCYGSYAMTRSAGTFNYIFGSTFIGATLSVEYTSGCYENQIRFEHNYALGVTKIVTDLVIEYTKN